MIVRKMTSWRARIPPPKKTSDVYAVTAGVKGGSFPPLKNLGISMSASALSLHLRTNFHHISFNSSVENRQIFKQKITFLDHFLWSSELLTTKFGFVVQQYIEIDSTAISYQAFCLTLCFWINSTPGCVSMMSLCYALGRNLVKIIRHKLSEFFSHYFEIWAFLSPRSFLITMLDW